MTIDHPIRLKSDNGRYTLPAGRISGVAGRPAGSVWKPPFDSEAQDLLGTVYLQLSEYSQAENCFRKVLAQQPAHAQACYGLGLAAGAQGNVIEATKYLKKSLEINLTTRMSGSGWARYSRLLGQHHEALGQYRRALKQDPDHLEAHIRLGDLALNLGISKSPKRPIARRCDCTRGRKTPLPDWRQSTCGRPVTKTSTGPSGPCWRRVRTTSALPSSMPMSADMYNAARMPSTCWRGWQLTTGRHSISASSSCLHWASCTTGWPIMSRPSAATGRAMT